MSSTRNSAQSGTPPPDQPTWCSAAPRAGARIPSSFPDGTSNTIVFGTRYTDCGGAQVGWAMGMCGPPTWPYSDTAANYLSLPLPQLAPNPKDGDAVWAYDRPCPC
jgi:hypothetical protein